MSLYDFLNAKPIFYKKMDYKRMPRAWESIKSILKPFKIIHVIGTNGKGSTGRFLAQILHKNGKSVGHYTSPHIFEFRERFWINGDIVCNEDLQKAHEKLQSILSEEFKNTTSYFEYATLLAAVLFCDCDYFVCEAGMGGEYDATNVFDKSISLFTPIGLDHTEILGDNIQKIATTKFKAMAKDSILNSGMQMSCVNVAKDIAKSLGCNLYFPDDILDKDDILNIQIYIKKYNLANFLSSNLYLACSAAKFLLDCLDIGELDSLNLRGRCEKIAHNLYVDVGHNELGAKAIAEHFGGQKFTLVYNSFSDKDFKAVLNSLYPLLKRVLIFKYDTPNRELATDEIKSTLADLKVDFSDFRDANLKEIKDAKNDDIYLVFGSFYLAEAFLKSYNKK